MYIPASSCISECQHSIFQAYDFDEWLVASNALIPDMDDMEWVSGDAMEEGFDSASPITPAESDFPFVDQITLIAGENEDDNAERCVDPSYLVSDGKEENCSAWCEPRIDTSLADLAKTSQSLSLAPWSEDPTWSPPFIVQKQNCPLTSGGITSGGISGPFHGGHEGMSMIEISDATNLPSYTTNDNSPTWIDTLVDDSLLDLDEHQNNIATATSNIPGPAEISEQGAASTLSMLHSSSFPPSNKKRPPSRMSLLMLMSQLAATQVDEIASSATKNYEMNYKELFEARAQTLFSVDRGEKYLIPFPSLEKSGPSSVACHLEEQRLMELITAMTPYWKHLRETMEDIFVVKTQENGRTRSRREAYLFRYTRAAILQSGEWYNDATQGWLISQANRSAYDPLVADILERCTLEVMEQALKVNGSPLRKKPRAKKVRA